jgi:hypothetical protein
MKIQVFDKELEVISFKAFLKEMQESEKDVYAQWNALVNVDKEKHLSLIESQKDSLTGKEYKDLLYLNKLIEKTDRKWNKMDFLKSSKFIGVITDAKINNDKQRQLLYGHQE